MQVPHARLTTTDVIRLAAQATLHPRTVERCYGGAPATESTRARLRAAALALALPLPPCPPPRSDGS